MVMDIWELVEREQGVSLNRQLQVIQTTVDNLFFICATLCFLKKHFSIQE